MDSIIENCTKDIKMLFKVEIFIADICKRKGQRWRSVEFVFNITLYGYRR